MPNPNTGEVNPLLEPTGDLKDSTQEESLAKSAAKQKVPVGDQGSNKETEGGRENQEQTRKSKSSKNNDVGDDTSAKK